MLKTVNPQSIQATIGISNETLLLEVDREQFRKIRLVDTAGQERFMSLAPQEVKRCDAVILVFDITSKESFEDLANWIDLAKEHARENTVFYLCANKVDREHLRKVENAESKKLVKSENLDGLFNTSAMTGQNVLELLKAIVNLLEKRELTKKLSETQSKINL